MKNKRKTILFAILLLLLLVISFYLIQKKYTLNGVKREPGAKDSLFMIGQMDSSREDELISPTILPKEKSGQVDNVSITIRTTIIPETTINSDEHDHLRPSKATDATKVPEASQKPIVTDVPDAVRTPKITGAAETPSALKTPSAQRVTQKSEMTSTPVQKTSFTPVPTLLEYNTPTLEPISTPATHVHEWVLISSIVHHKEEGHYEEAFKTLTKRIYYSGLCANTRPVKTIYEILLEEGKWDEKAEYVSVTYNNNDTYISLDQFKFMNSEEYSIFVAFIKENRTSAVTRNGWLVSEEEQLVSDGTKWVIDVPAYDEEIITGRRCLSCGETEQGTP